MNSLFVAGGEICTARISDKERKEKISKSKQLIDFPILHMPFSLTTERQYLQFDRAQVILKISKCRLDFSSQTTAELRISTVYPKSRFRIKQHKTLVFQGFSMLFQPLARKAEKENCKFEP